MESLDRFEITSKNVDTIYPRIAKLLPGELQGLPEIKETVADSLFQVMSAVGEGVSPDSAVSLFTLISDRNDELPFRPAIHHTLLAAIPHEARTVYAVELGQRLVTVTETAVRSLGLGVDPETVLEDHRLVYVRSGIVEQRSLLGLIRQSWKTGHFRTQSEMHGYKPAGPGIAKRAGHVVGRVAEAAEQARSSLVKLKKRERK